MMLKLYKPKLRRTTKRLRSRQVLQHKIYDFCLGFFGVFLALGSAYFPYYVFNNEDSFSPPVLFLERLDDDNGELMKTESLVLRDDNLKSVENTGIDFMKTGSIKKADPKARAENGSLKKSAAIKKVDPIFSLKYQLIFASKGGALVQVGDDVMFVVAGSLLPDGSMVKSVKKEGGKWKLKTKANAALVLE